MRLTLTFAALALALPSLVAACDSGGGPATGTTTPGGQTSAFDQFFALGSGRGGANDANGEASANDCVDSDCPTDPTLPEPEPCTPPVCNAALPIPAGALAACQGFCAKITGCLGQPDAASACASDCASTLSGTEIAAVQQIFACFADATCDDLAAWQGGSGGSGSSTDPGDPRPATDASDASGGASGENGTDPAPDAPDDTPDVPEREVPPPDSGEVIVYANPIGDCVEAAFMGWVEAPLSASKAAVCDAVPSNEERCSSADIGSGTSTGSGSADASGSDAPPASSGGGADPASPGDNSGAPEPDPREEDPNTPPDYEYYDDHASDVAACHAYAGLLSEVTFARLGSCDALEDCDARRDCLDQVVACAPFVTFAAFFGGDSTTSVTVEPVDPDPSTPPTPPTPTDPPTPR